MEVRLAVPSDAAALAAMMTKNCLPLVRFGHELDADGLMAVLEERCVEAVYVGANGDGIQGCAMLARGSLNRRDCPPSQRFLLLFAVDQASRMTPLAGQLMNAVFVDVFSNPDVNTVRIEAFRSTPTLSIDVRSGFRSYPRARADERGIVPMYFPLPALVRQLAKVDDGQSDLSSVLSRRIRPPRLPKSAGRAPLDVGVSYREGRVVVDYDTQPVRGVAMTASLDLVSGDIVEVTSDPPGSIPAEFEWLESVSDKVAVRAEALGSTAEESILAEKVLTGGVRLTLTGDGTLRLLRDGRTMVMERWPAVLGMEAPSVFQRWGSAVSVRDLGDQWELTGNNDVVRIIRFLPGPDVASGLEVSTCQPDSRRIVISGWTFMRKAEHALQLDGQWIGGPVFQGLWPCDWHGMEAASNNGEFESATASAWTDAATGVVMTWSGAKPRFEGRSLPQLVGQTPGGEISYRLMLVDPGEVRPAVATTGFTLESRGSPDSVESVQESAGSSLGESGSTTSPPQSARTTDNVPWVTEGDAARCRLRCEGHDLRIAPQVGVIEWCQAGQTIVSGPYPSSVAQAELVARRVGLWCCSMDSRWDEDRGVEWAEDDEAWAFSEAAGVPGTWSVQAVSEQCLEVIVTEPEQASASGTDLDETASTTPETGQVRVGESEIVITMVPKLASPQCPVVRLGARVWTVDNARHDWYGGVDAVALELPDGRMLVVEPSASQGVPEVFVRWVQSTIVLQLLGSSPASEGVGVQTPPRHSWRLTVLDDRPTAVGHLFSQV
ncbi:MAG: hypothetical protein FWF25_01980 [Propionibacteriaceae bacterium]|nr:hypothetical protein [Propionibacteriaceae bacterium]